MEGSQLMHVSHLLPTLGTGGAESLVVDLVSQLTLLGHSAEILTLSGSGGVPLERAKSAGIPLRVLGTNPRDPRAVTKLRSATRDADIVHVHLFPALYFAAFARVGPPKVYTEHSTSNRRRSVKAFRLTERLAYEKYAAIVAISDAVKQSLRTHFELVGVDKEIRVIRNAVGPRFFTGTATPSSHVAGTLRLVAIGTLDGRKNFSEAIEAVRQVPGTTLSVVGHGPHYATLHNQVRLAGLQDRVRFLGQRSDVSSLIDEHDALLSTSLIEGFGLVAAEAMSRGRPVIGPNIPGLNEVVKSGETGLLYSRDMPHLTDLIVN